MKSNILGSFFNPTGLNPQLVAKTPLTGDTAINFPVERADDGNVVPYEYTPVSSINGVTINDTGVINLYQRTNLETGENSLWVFTDNDRNEPVQPAWPEVEERPVNLSWREVTSNQAFVDLTPDDGIETIDGVILQPDPTNKNENVLWVSDFSQEGNTWRRMPLADLEIVTNRVASVETFSPFSED